MARVSSAGAPTCTFDRPAAARRSAPLRAAALRARSRPRCHSASAVRANGAFSPRHRRTAKCARSRRRRLIGLADVERARRPRRAARRHPARPGASAQIRSPVRRHASRRSSTTSACATSRRASSGGAFRMPEHFGREPLMIGRRSHLRQPCEQPIPEQHRPVAQQPVPSPHECYYNRWHVRTEATSSTRRTRRSRSAVSSSPSATREREATDTSGRAIADLLTAAGHEVTGRTIVKDDPALVRSTIERQLARTRRAGDHHDRRHRHHVARQHLSRRSTRCSKSGSTDSASCSGCSATSRSAPPR